MYLLKIINFCVFGMMAVSAMEVAPTIPGDESPLSGTLTSITELKENAFSLTEEDMERLDRQSIPAYTISYTLCSSFNDHLTETWDSLIEKVQECRAKNSKFDQVCTTTIAYGSPPVSFIIDKSQLVLKSGYGYFATLTDKEKVGMMLAGASFCLAKKKLSQVFALFGTALTAHVIEHEFPFRDTFVLPVERGSGGLFNFETYLGEREIIVFAGLTAMALKSDVFSGIGLAVSALIANTNKDDLMTVWVASIFGYTFVLNAILNSML